VVEGTTLEMWRGGNLTESSNLSLSAEIFLAVEALENPSAFGLCQGAASSIAEQRVRLKFCAHTASSSNG
jgi:hypothetical protein